MSTIIMPIIIFINLIVHTYEMIKYSIVIILKIGSILIKQFYQDNQAQKNWQIITIFLINIYIVLLNKLLL